MDLKEIGINTSKWVDSAQDRDYWSPCECGIEHPCSISQGVSMFSYLLTYRFSKNDFQPLKLRLDFTPLLFPCLGRKIFFCSSYRVQRCNCHSWFVYHKCCADSFFQNSKKFIYKINMIYFVYMHTN